jgi:hypothetical protein
LADAGLDFVYKTAHGKSAQRRVGFAQDASVTIVYAMNGAAGRH